MYLRGSILRTGNAGSFEFTGNQYLTRGSQSLMSVDDDALWISVWVKSSLPSQNATIIGQAAQHITADFIWLFRASNNLRIQVSNGSTRFNRTYTNYFLGFTDVWVKLDVVLNYQTSSIQMYRNTIKVGDAGVVNMMKVTTPRTISIGSYSSVANFFRGSISLLKFYNRLPEDNELKLLYQGLPISKYKLSRQYDLTDTYAVEGSAFLRTSDRVNRNDLTVIGATFTTDKPF
jgi:hypothetical protein